MMRIRKILETCLYVDDLEKARRFYEEVLGLELFAKEEGRHVFFHCGNSMLLVFNPEKTVEPDQDVPAHGTKGAGHIAFAIAAKDYDNWKNRLSDNEVEIEKEMEWQGGGKSIYFRDPSGNSIELTTPQTWKTSDA